MCKFMYIHTNLSLYTIFLYIYIYIYVIYFLFVFLSYIWRDICMCIVFIYSDMSYIYINISDVSRSSSISLLIHLFTMCLGHVSPMRTWGYCTIQEITTQHENPWATDPHLRRPAIIAAIVQCLVSVHYEFWRYKRDFKFDRKTFRYLKWNIEHAELVNKHHVNCGSAWPKAERLGCSYIALTQWKTHILCWLEFRAAQSRCVRKPETEAEKRAKKKAATAKATVDKKAEAEAKKKPRPKLETVELRLHTPFIAVQTRSFSTDSQLHCICLTGKTATAKATVDKKAEAEAKKKPRPKLETVELRLHTPFIAVQTRSFSTDSQLHCICLTGKTGHERQKKQSQTGQASRRNSRTGCGVHVTDQARGNFLRAPCYKRSIWILTEEAVEGH